VRGLWAGNPTPPECGHAQVRRASRGDQYRRAGSSVNGGRRRTESVNCCSMGTRKSRVTARLGLGLSVHQPNKREDDSWQTRDSIGADLSGNSDQPPAETFAGLPMPLRQSRTVG
jgi:hypothetical protein